MGLNCPSEGHIECEKISSMADSKGRVTAKRKKEAEKE
jgi:hypothetical protein